MVVLVEPHDARGEHEGPHPALRFEVDDEPDELADAQGFQNASQAGATLGDLMAGKFGSGSEDKE